MASLVLTGDTSGQVTLAAPAVAGTNTLTLQAATATSAVNILSTPVASTSGATIDFNSIPAWVKKITVMLAGVSTNGTSDYLVQIGAGSVDATGYLGASLRFVSGATVAGLNYTTGFGINNGTQTAAYVTNGLMTLSLLNSSSYLWVASGVFGGSDSATNTSSGGSKTLSGVLDRVRITTVGGTNTFDAGSVNLLLEG